MDPWPWANEHIYLTYREIFENKNVRKSKAIRKILLCHQSKLEASDDAHIDKIVSVLKPLLKAGVFQSVEQARKHFPDLFKRPPSERPTGNITKKRKASRRRSINVGQVVRTEPIDKSSSGTTAEISIFDHQRKQSLQVTLRSAELPYNVQHHILSLSQQILEEACFRFMKQWLPSLLEERGWTCAAAVELTEGVRVIEKHLNILPNGCMSTEQQKGFKEILPHVTQLRHTAVHRRLLASDQLQEQVHCAYVLAEVLQDNECRDKLQIIRRSVDGGVKDMKKQTEEMKQELERRLKQLELTLQTTIAQQQSSISLAAGQKLVDSINKELRPCYPSAAAEIKGTFTCDEHARNTGDIILVDENDIESDEDRLQTEL